MQNDPNIRGLNEKQAAIYLGLSAQYLRISRMAKSQKDAPPFVKIGARIIYLRDDLDQWLESHRQIAAA